MTLDAWSKWFVATDCFFCVCICMYMYLCICLYNIICVCMNVYARYMIKYNPSTDVLLKLCIRGPGDVHNSSVAHEFSLLGKKNPFVMFCDMSSLFCVQSKKRNVDCFVEIIKKIFQDTDRWWGVFHNRRIL